MELSQPLRAQIVALINTGMSQSDFGRCLNTSQQNVCRTMQRFNATKSFNSRKRSGRPHITSSTTDRVLHRAVVADPFISSRTLAQQFPEISTRTIRRRLSTKFGLTARRPAKKPLLSAKNRKDRLAFCHKFRQWTSEDWSKSSVLQCRCASGETAKRGAIQSSILSTHCEVFTER